MAGGRRGGRLFIIVALILIVVLGVVIFLFKDQIFPAQQPAPTQGAENPQGTAVPAQTNVKTVEVIALTQPLGGGISLGTKITPEMLMKVKILEESYFPELYYLVGEQEGEEFKEVIGKYARYPLKERVILTRGMLTDTPPGSSAANLVPAGYVAIPIPISNLTSVSYALEPGDHVNVIAAIQLIDLDTSFQTALPNTLGLVSETLPPPEGGGTVYYSVQVTGGGPAQGRMEAESSIGKTIYVIPSEAQRPRLVSQTLIQDAVVLWVGESPGPGVDLTETFGKSKVITSVDAEGNETKTIPPAPTEITLIVTPQDAVTLNYLMLSGARLNLVLRSAGDTQRIQTEAVTLQFLMDQYRIPYPTKLPYGLEPRINGLYYSNSEVPVAPETP